MMENRWMQTRKTKDLQPNDLKKKVISLESIKQDIIALESKYTEQSLDFNKEWDFKHVRESTVEDIQKATSVDQLKTILLKLEQGFSHPHYLRKKKLDNQSSSEGESEARSSSDNEESNSED